MATTTQTLPTTSVSTVIPNTISNYSIFQYDNVVLCKLDGKNDHILKSPKVLPCGNTACYDCIIKYYDKNTKEIKCNFTKCNEVHLIEDIDLLKTNLIAEDGIKDNLETLTKSVYEKLHQAYKEAKSTLNSDKINTVFNNIESDIVTRVSVIQKELQRLQSDLIHIVKDFKENFMLKANKDFKIEEQNYLKITTNNSIADRIMKKSKSFTNSNNNNKGLIENDENIRKNLYECESYLRQLNNFTNTFKDKLNNIQFKTADDWIPDSSIIGKLVGTSINKFLIKLIHNKPKLINFDNESLHGLCNLFDESLLITCVDTHKLMLVNKHFNLIKQTNSIGDINFNCPLGVCHNNSDSIYICDLMNHRLVMLDQQMNFKKTIGESQNKQGSNELGKFDRPVDCCYYAGNLYVLDCRNKRIQEFDSNGTFKREIKLVKIAFNVDKRASMMSNDESAYQKRPLRLDVTEDTIAVIDDYEELFIYNFAGDLKQMIKKCRLMCFVDNYLFTCDDHGLLTCYEKYKFNENEEYLPLFKRKIEILHPPISFMRFFNGQLIISLGGSKKGLAIF